MKKIILISVLCFVGCNDATFKEGEGKAWEFRPDKGSLLDAGSEDLGLIDVNIEDVSAREFNIDGCWDADFIEPGESKSINFSGFRQNACIMDQSRTGYFKVDVPAGFRIQANEFNYSRPTLLNSCAEISPQFCQSDQNTEQLAQNNSDQSKEIVLEYFSQDPRDPIAKIQLYPLADNIACDSPRTLNLGESVNADMKNGGTFGFNPCALELNQNATQFYQVDVPLGENYFVEIMADDPEHQNFSAQVVNIYRDGFSCDSPVAESCLPVIDLAVANDSLFLFRLDALWGSGRDPARAIIAISGTTMIENSGYSIGLRKADESF